MFCLKQLINWISHEKKTKSKKSYALIWLHISFEAVMINCWKVGLKMKTIVVNTSFSARSIFLERELEILLLHFYSLIEFSKKTSSPQNSAKLCWWINAFKLNSKTKFSVQNKVSVYTRQRIGCDDLVL